MSMVYTNIFFPVDLRSMILQRHVAMSYPLPPFQLLTEQFWHCDARVRLLCDAVSALGDRRRMEAVRLTLPLLLLLLLALLAHSCLHCDPDFQQKFTSYRRNMSWKSWWIGDRTTALNILENWKPRTLQGLQLNVAPEIPRDKLHSVANKVYEKLDSVYKEFMYKPGVFPQILSSVLKAQTLMLRDDIIQSRLDCERQCGIYEYNTISCISCNASVTTCFGYNCGTAEEWEGALASLPKYIKLMSLGTSQNTTRLPDVSGIKAQRYMPWNANSHGFTT